MSPDMSPAELRGLIRDVPDFPKPGVGFRDITPLLASPEGFRAAVRGLADLSRPYAPFHVLAAEARGFLFGPALASELGAGFVLARKPGKLPRETLSVAYELEYGIDRLEVHTDAIGPGHRVLIHDDLLATGGTARALCELVEKAGGEVVACTFLIELAFLPGRERLTGYDVLSLLRDETE
ncbi:MAG TPA: adenine phosphoribosyltransferase [Capillimicrobium sp.]|nr:adenine phosphoribosyltransferase [Capillimicrobium sp.]